MNNFINQENKLRLLNKQFEQPGASLTILYGRRRQGKKILFRKRGFFGDLCNIASSNERVRLVEPADLIAAQ